MGRDVDVEHQWIRYRSVKTLYISFYYWYLLWWCFILMSIDCWRLILSCQNNKVVCKKNYNKVVRTIVHKFAYLKTIECNNVGSSIGFACSSWNSVKRYDLVALSKIHVCSKVVTVIWPCCTDATIWCWFFLIRILYSCESNPLLLSQICKKYKTVKCDVI